MPKEIDPKAPAGATQEYQADKPPLHAFELRINLGAETWPLAVVRLRELLAHVEEHGPDCGLQSGGGGSCASVTIAKRDVTPEQYRKELMDWMGRQRRGGSDG